jgi:glycosyltransferase involved in cell wall biosynthesis
MSIPPNGWGAVESLIWDYYIELKKLGHEVQIINVQNNLEIIKQANEFKPDFVHLQYDDYAHLLQHIDCKYKAVTSHYGYIEQYQNHPEYHHILHNFINGDFLIFCLSEGIRQVYIKLGVDPKRLYVTPNGARDDLFNYNEIPEYSDRSIYLAKIDYRKRQYIYQNINNLYFAGNCVDHRFNINKNNYLGEWSKNYLYQKLTEYGNLVLLSDGEADPLVTKEALIAGLGLVISEFATANLDLNQSFIDVIPTDKLNDIDYINNIIIKNREVCKRNRHNIRNYALANHSWPIIIDKYCKLINNIITK